MANKCRCRLTIDNKDGRISPKIETTLIKDVNQPNQKPRKPFKNPSETFPIQIKTEEKTFIN